MLDISYNFTLFSGFRQRWPCRSTLPHCAEYSV